MSKFATPEARAIAEVKLMGASDPARQNEMLDLARSIYRAVAIAAVSGGKRSLPAIVGARE